MKSFGLLLAAGHSVRMGAYGSKMWMMLQGRPALVWSLLRFAAAGQFDGGVIVVPAEQQHRIAPWLREFGLTHWKVTPGGADRYLSVQCGLHALDGALEADDVVLVHDAARIMVSKEVIDRVRTAAQEWGAAVPGLMVTDTVKQVEEIQDHLEVRRTVPRKYLWLAQTPQGFRYALISQAHQSWTGGVPTDDAEVVESFGESVVMVAGDPDNRKLTTPADLAWFEWRLLREL